MPRLSVIRGMPRVLPVENSEGKKEGGEERRGKIEKKKRERKEKTEEGGRKNRKIARARVEQRAARIIAEVVLGLLTNRATWGERGKGMPAKR